MRQLGQGRRRLSVIRLNAVTCGSPRARGATVWSSARDTAVGGLHELPQGCRQALGSRRSAEPSSVASVSARRAAERRRENAPRTVHMGAE